MNRFKEFFKCFNLDDIDDTELSTPLSNLHYDNFGNEYISFYCNKKNDDVYNSFLKTTFVNGIIRTHIIHYYERCSLLEFNNYVPVYIEFNIIFKKNDIGLGLIMMNNNDECCETYYINLDDEEKEFFKTYIETQINMTLESFWEEKSKEKNA